MFSCPEPDSTEWLLVQVCKLHYARAQRCSPELACIADSRLSSVSSGNRTA